MDFDYFYLEDDPEEGNKKVQSWAPKVIQKDNQRKDNKGSFKKQSQKDRIVTTIQYQNNENKTVRDEPKTKDGVMDFLKKKYEETAEESIGQKVSREQIKTQTYQNLSNKGNGQREYPNNNNIINNQDFTNGNNYKEREFQHDEYISRQPENKEYERQTSENTKNVYHEAVNESSYRDLGILGMKRNATEQQKEKHENYGRHDYEDLQNVETMNDINHTNNEEQEFTPTGDLAALGDELMGGFDW